MWLGRRASTVFRHLSDYTKANYEMAAAVLGIKIWSQSWQALYQIHLYSQVKQNREGWAEYGDDLKTLAEKAYPDLVEAAKECFALNHTVFLPVEKPPSSICIHVLNLLWCLPNWLSLLRLLLMLVCLPEHGVCRCLKFVVMHACCLCYFCVHLD